MTSTQESPDKALGVTEALTAELEGLLALSEENRRVCPQPKKWDDFWKLLPNRKQVGAGWDPPLPLILGAWWHTSDQEKRERFKSHIRWAAEHGALTEAASFIKSLRPEEWHHEGV